MEAEAQTRRWEAFEQEALVRLGPRRFDELSATTRLFAERAITLQEAVARSRYFMLPDHEDLHEHFHALLKM